MIVTFIIRRLFTSVTNDLTHHISTPPRFIYRLSNLNTRPSNYSIALEPYVISYIVTIVCFLFYTLDNTVARGSHSSSEKSSLHPVRDVQGPMGHYFGHPRMDA